MNIETLKEELKKCILKNDYHKSSLQMIGFIAILRVLLEYYNNKDKYKVINLYCNW